MSLDWFKAAQVVNNNLGLSKHLYICCVQVFNQMQLAVIGMLQRESYPPQSSTTRILLIRVVQLLQMIVLPV